MVRNQPNRAALAVLAGALLCACEQPPPEVAPAPPVAADWLIEIGAEAGLDFRHDSGLDSSFFMPQIMGSGGALFDYDLDGDLDVFLVDSGRRGSGAPGALFRREADGQYGEVTARAGLTDPGYGMGATVGDYDNDGDLDLFVTRYGRNSLYRNAGDGSFEDVSEAAGIGDDAWSTSASFFDYDLDGFLDLYVANYLTYDPARSCADQSGRTEYCGPQAFPGAADFLYHNLGDGRFAEVAREAGTHSTAGKGLGVVTGDFDDDGDQDVYVANDGVANQLWINLGTGRFEDRAYAFGVAVNGFGQPEAGMGIALGDADGDLSLDLFVTHHDRETNTLYGGTAAGVFQDATAVSGLGPDSLPWTGFGTGFLDLENDGDLDLIVVNGRVRRAAGVPTPSDALLAAYAEPNALALNIGSGRFADHCAAARAFCGAREVSRALMLGDVDADGDLDALVTNSNGPVRLYRNDAPDPGHWLVVRALDARQRRDAVGSRVYVLADETWRVRPVTHAMGYLSATEATVHFGLGRSARAGAIVVRWPDGAHERFPATAADRRLTVTRGEGVPASPPGRSQ